jgi:lysine 6-dehydrogenase
MKIVVLGAGLVGGAMAVDLAAEPGVEVTAVDASQAAVDRLDGLAGVRGVRADLLEEGRLSALVADCDLVVNAVPGFMGFETLRRIITAGKNVVDISFFNEDAFLLDDLAASKGVTAVVDCGVAPGLCNILAGYVYEQLDETHSYLCLVGGLPDRRQWPYEYKAVFSPIDVLEEYTRPARFVAHGRQVVRPALSDVELVNLPNVDTLEAFNTDGVRSLMKTLDIPFMREKTLRYPGHAKLMRVFRESGFFETTPVTVDGQMVRPLSLTAKLIFDQWRLGEGESEYTVMQVVLEGVKDGRRLRYTYDMLDRYHHKTRTTSMARTTGYTGTIVARQVAKGLFARKGICPPELVGRTAGCFEDLEAEYAKRDIHLHETVTEID